MTTRRCRPWSRPRPGVRVHHVDAGPPEFVPKERLLPHMPAFARQACRLLRGRGCDVVHANFFMSGWGRAGAAAPAGVSRW
ncbi:MAG: glycosyltransferase [Comamonadaceae bacterium]|nr:glycosyltransferase [Comamonadaceae bacterium]